MAAKSMVQLEMDDKDKENFQELQKSSMDAQQELANVTTKLRTRNAEGKHASLMYAELAEIPDATRTYEQCGKPFIAKPLAQIKAEMKAKAEACEKEVATLTEKRKHVEETYKKVQADFQEFVKAHLVDKSDAAEEKKEKPGGLDVD